MMFVPHRKHAYRTPRPVSGIALLFYMQIIFVLHRKHTYGPPRPVTGISLLYVDDVHTSRETHVWASMACYGGRFTVLFVCSYFAGNIDVCLHIRFWDISTFTVLQPRRYTSGIEGSSLLEYFSRPSQ
jgi:hypothetical protein